MNDTLLNQKLVYIFVLLLNALIFDVEFDIHTNTIKLTSQSTSKYIYSNMICMYHSMDIFLDNAILNIEKPYH